MESLTHASKHVHCESKMEVSVEKSVEGDNRREKKQKKRKKKDMDPKEDENGTLAQEYILLYYFLAV